MARRKKIERIGELPPAGPIPLPGDILPTNGTARTMVTITARIDLTGVTDVLFGGNKAEIIARMPPTTIQVKAPHGDTGKVKIVVSTPHGDFELGEFAYEEKAK
jgi:hypothetical protein